MAIGLGGSLFSKSSPAEESARMEKSLAQKMFDILKVSAAESKKQFIIKMAIILFVSIMVGGLMAEYIAVSLKKINQVYFDPFSIIYSAFALSFGPVFTILTFFIGLVGVTRFGLMTKNNDTYDAERNYTKAGTGTYGTDRKATPKDEDNAFHESKNIQKDYEDILGLNSRGMMCSRIDKPLTNKNVAIVGAPGTGKSVSIVIPWIMQNIRRGHSFIATDSKGDIYRKTVALARKAGYKIRILNLKPEELANSDAVNFMSIIRGSDINASTVVECIMTNTNEGQKKDFWYEGEKNLLTAVILYVDMTSSIPDKEKNLAKVYEIISGYSVDEFESLFSSIGPTHPAYSHFKIWQNGTSTVKESSLSGLGIRLSLLAVPEIKQIISHDEIDLRAPGEEKCAYYIVIHDQTRVTNFLAALFFSELFIELINSADNVHLGPLPVPVNFIIDEFRNIGGIPNFNGVLSTVRSRNVGCTFIIQDINQLMEMYPNNVHNTILGCCTTKILLGTNDIVTAQWFSTLTGEETVRVKNRSYQENQTDLIKMHDHENRSEGEGKRAVYTVGEIIHLDLSEMLVAIYGEPATFKLKKLPYFADYPGSKITQKGRDGKMHHPHPMVQYMTEEGANTHIPAWREEYDKVKSEHDAMMERNEKAREEIKSLGFERKPRKSRR